MFKAIRKEKSDIPIIIMSCPKFNLTDDEQKRLNIIETMYQNTLPDGDKNLYFIDGKILMRVCGNEGTVDGCQPTDYGFASMDKAMGKALENLYFSPKNK